MSSDTTCNLAPLTAYSPTAENPWNVSKVNHLYRRLGFGATKDEVITALMQNNPSVLVDSLVDAALSLAPNPAPEWGFWNLDQFQAAEMANEDNNSGYYREQGKFQMVSDCLQNKLRDRMTLFWSNHFVTQDREYRAPSYQFQYHNLIQLHALGNFRDFVYDIGIAPAMLVYLNGDENTRDRPNENYARELFELFTLGVDNGYTEDDIIETSKALTGWVDRNEITWGPILFDTGRFSNDTKTIFGQSGNWGYDDVINILFSERQNLIAQFICGKLYTYFVSPTCSEDIVNEMANTFITNNFEIAPVLRELFKSEHFFDQEAIGAIIKSPSDLCFSFYTETSFALPAGINHIDYLNGVTTTLGQEFLNPIDVEGWQGDEDWISPDLLIGRWDAIRYVLDRAWEQNQEQFRSFVLGLPIGTNADGTLNNSYQADEVTIVVKAILDYFLPRGLQDTALFEEAIGIFKGDVYPDSYYEPDAVNPNVWTMTLMGVPAQIYALMTHIAEIPEFHLK